MQRSKRTTITGLNGVPRLIVGSLSKRTFQGEALVKSARARDSRCRSRVKFNLFSKYWYYTTRRPPFSDHSLFESFESIMARFKEFCQILLLLLPCQSYFWWRLYNLLRVVSSRIPDFAYENNRFDLDEINDDGCKAEFEVIKCHTCKTSFICCRNKI